jgi:hypothetical protein
MHRHMLTNIDIVMVGEVVYVIRCSEFVIAQCTSTMLIIEELLVSSTL